MTTFQGKDVFVFWKLSRDRPNLSGFEGKFFSDELDVRYSIVSRAGRLIVTRGRDEAELLPLEKGPDAFVGSEWWAEQIRFHRNERGSVDGLSLSTGRLQNVEFRKE
jgi:hypothetical protein